MQFWLLLWFFVLLLFILGGNVHFRRQWWFVHHHDIIVNEFVVVVVVPGLHPVVLCHFQKGAQGWAGVRHLLRYDVMKYRLVGICDVEAQKRFFSSHFLTPVRKSIPKTSWVPNTRDPTESRPCDANQAEYCNNLRLSGLLYYPNEPPTTVHSIHFSSFFSRPLFYRPLFFFHSDRNSQCRICRPVSIRCSTMEMVQVKWHWFPQVTSLCDIATTEFIYGMELLEDERRAKSGRIVPSKRSDKVDDDQVICILLHERLLKDEGEEEDGEKEEMKGGGGRRSGSDRRKQQARWRIQEVEKT